MNNNLKLFIGHIFVLYILLNGCTTKIETHRSTVKANYDINSSDEIEVGKKYYSLREYEKALHIFETGYSLSLEDTNKARTQEFLFNLAITRQQLAEIEDVDTVKIKLLEEAVRDYEEILENRPNSGAALNNLAGIYSSLGKVDEARESYRQAIELNDSRKAFYSKNYADFLLDLDKKDQAVEYYEKSIDLQPSDIQAQRNLVNLYILEKNKKIFTHLWKLYQDGQVTESQDFAFLALKENGWSSSEKKEFLSIIVANLSEQFYKPEIFVTQELCIICDKLNQFSGDTDINEGIFEIFKLNIGTSLSLNEFSWWKELDEKIDSIYGLKPVESFSLLIRSLGDWYKKQRNFVKAEAYYRLGIGIIPPAADPDAFLKLIDLYFLTGDFEKILHNMEEHLPKLFHGKGIAYRVNDPIKIYKFHKTLGITFAILEVWGDSSHAPSAIFQLEHALQTAERINNQYIELRIVTYLAEAYRKTGQDKQAFILLIRYAEKYLADDDMGEVRELVQELKGEKIPTDLYDESYKIKYDALLRRFSMN